MTTEMQIAFNASTEFAKWNSKPVSRKSAELKSAELAVKHRLNKSYMKYWIDGGGKPMATYNAEVGTKRNYCVAKISTE